jgi:hypothetical protein
MTLDDLAALRFSYDAVGSTRFDLNPQANVSEVSVVEDTGQDAVDGEVDPPDPAEPSADEWARMNAGEGTA